MGCPCGAGFMCMRGGCVARAAAGTKTFKDDVSKSEFTQSTPDEHFSTCCHLLDVPSSCTGLCSYSSYSTEEVSAVLLQQSQCQPDSLQKVHFCAARGTNHTECCVRSFIPQQCHSFCDQGGENDVDKLSLAHLQCVHYFNDIKTCFVEYANSEYFEGYRESSQLTDPQSEDTSLGAAF
uniref:DB domain-containing protein n=1 Tax=Caenorhabditis japonica TaxID=281687 RepID=A0A8R1I2N3_CAEJA